MLTRLWLADDCEIDSGRHAILSRRIQNEKIMAKSYRQERINEIIKELLSEVLLQQIKDPRVGMVTITSVRVTNDLSLAKVYFSVMGDEVQREETARGLKSARNFMRNVIGKELKIHNSPELKFVYDDSLDKSFAIEEALKKAKKDESGDV